MINYTLLDLREKFLIEGLCEYPAFAKQGPEKCLQQIANGLQVATEKAGVHLEDVIAVGARPGGAAASLKSAFPAISLVAALSCRRKRLTGPALFAVTTC